MTPTSPGLCKCSTRRAQTRLCASHLCAAPRRPAGTRPRRAGQRGRRDAGRLPGRAAGVQHTVILTGAAAGRQGAGGGVQLFSRFFTPGAR